MIRALLMIVFISVFKLGFAQTDSIQSEIVNSYNSKSMLINKGRALLLDKFLSGDLGKTAELESYLTTKLSNNEYIALYPIEQWLIKYWTKDYENLIINVLQYDSINYTLQRKVHPQTDNLYAMLKEKTYNQRQILINSIKESSIPIQDKDFLIMHLNSCLLTKDTKDITQDTLNDQADNFISKYPNNEFIGFTRKYIRYKLVTSNWGYSFEFFTGYGIFSGKLQEHFSNNIPFGVAFDVYYKNFALYFRDYIGFSSTNHEFTDGSTVWNKNSQVRVFLPEASIGYVIHDSKHLKLAPFVGISSTDITPTEYDLQQKPGLKEYELSFTTTYTVGFNVDLKFGKPRVAMVTNGPEKSYWFMRLRYGYNFPQFSKSYPGINGNMQYITIGFGGFGSKMKRDN